VEYIFLIFRFGFSSVFEKILDSVWNELDLVKKCGYGIVEFDIPLDTL